MRPNNPEELLDRLTHVAPQFRAEWEDEDNEFVEEGRFSYHGVMLAFSEYFSMNIRQFSEEQVRALSVIFNEAVTKDDPLENAVSTCFLEHLHQLKVTKLFRPFLGPDARRKSRA